MTEAKKNAKLGLIHYYYGKGAGKTSIGLGHITRALGWDLHPILIQFLKKHDPKKKEGFFYGEYRTLTEILKVPVVQFGDFKFIMKKEDITEIQRENAKNTIKILKEILASTKYDLVILDEIVTFISLGFMEVKELVKILEERKNNCEVIITGREFIPELEVISDYITHLEEKKHPFQKGIQARSGIEF